MELRIPVLIIIVLLLAFLEDVACLHDSHLSRIQRQ